MSQDLALQRNSTFQPVQTAGIAFAAIMVAHAAVDALSMLVPSSLGLLEARLQLTAEQSAWLVGVGPLFSGLVQPICALASDRFSTRQPGVWGVVLGVLGIGSLGLVNNFLAVAIIYALGVIGIGMFHPVAAATAGHLWPERRSTAVSYFFVTGMVGGVLGAMFWPRVLITEAGFQYLPLIVAPILILALVLHRSFGGIKPPATRHEVQIDSAAIPKADWAMVGVLYVSAVLRFCVDMALIYLFVRWTQSVVAAEHLDWSKEKVAEAAAPMVGNLNASKLVGMASGGMAAGMFVRTGKEKWPMVLVPLLFSPVIAILPHLPVQVGYLCAVAAGLGFASMIPVTIALAQRLMPKRTNLASSLMMGGAWAVAMMGPRAAAFSVEQWGIPTTFLLTAATLAMSGLVCLPVRNRPE